MRASEPGARVGCPKRGGSPVLHRLNEARQVMPAGNHAGRAWVIWAVLGASVVAPARVAPAQVTQAKRSAASAPGQTVVIKVVGPDGQPLTGVVAHHLTAFGSPPTRPSASAELNAVR